MTTSRPTDSDIVCASNAGEGLVRTSRSPQPHLESWPVVMTDQNRESCSRCGASFVPETPSDTTVLMCLDCQAVSETALYRPATVEDSTTLALEHHSLSPTQAGPPISGSDTIERHPDPQATTSINPARVKAVSKTVIATLEHGTRLGRFEILAILGRGAFGMVYRAHDPVLERDVAVKVPRYVSEDDQGAKFLEEAKAPAKLRHPNIVAVFESGQVDGQPFIVGELVDGTPLSVILRQGRLPFSTAVSWIRQIAEALHYAHLEGVVHRDVKPSNVMITANGRPQLMDFGLAIRVDSENSDPGDGAIVGTPAYMAPEQARGEVAQIGPLSDQYSLGSMFYEMLTGRTPYMGQLWTVVKQVADETSEPPPLAEFAANIPLDLEAACLKAMSKHPQNRYPDLLTFAEDMKHWEDGEPLLARPIGRIERLKRWYQRNTMIALLLSLIAVGIVAFAVFRGHQADVARRLAAEAKSQAEAAKKAQRNEEVARKQAENAQIKEKAAHDETERMLVATYNEAGLYADREGDRRLALLWFGMAVEAAKGEQRLEAVGRQRFETWASEVALPIHGHRARGGWNKKLLFHPQEPYLMVLSLEPVCEIWDLRTDKQIELPITGEISNAAWNHNGTRLGLASGNTVNVFEFPSGRELECWEQSDPVTDIAFAPHAEWVAVGGTNGVSIRDYVAKQDVGTKRPHPTRVNELLWAPNGTTLATHGEDKFVRVFAIKAGTETTEPLMPPMPVFQPTFSGMHFLSDTKLLLLEERNALRVWDLSKKESLWHRRGDDVTTLRVSPRRDLFAFSEYFDTVIVDASSCQERQRIRHRNIIYNSEFSPDSRFLLSGGGDHTEKVTEVATGRIVLSNIPHSGTVHRSCWSPDGKAIATVQWNDPIVRVWKSVQFSNHDFRTATHARQSYLKFNRTGDLALAVGFDSIRDRQELTPFDVSTGEPAGTTYKTTGTISDANFVDPHNALLVVGTKTYTRAVVSDESLTGEGFINLVNRQSGERLAEDLSTESAALATAVSADGTTAIVLCQKGHLLVLDADSLKVRAEHQVLSGKPQSHSFLIRRRLAIAPSEDRFAVWGTRGDVEMRDLTTGNLLFQLKTTSDIVHDVVFHPNGQSFVTCCSNGVVQQWRSDNGQTHGPDFKHSGWVFTGEFTRDGQWFITACGDRHARVWNVADGGTPVSTREHTDEVYSILIDPSQKTFFTGCKNGVLRRWDMMTGGQITADRKLSDQIYQLAIVADGTRLLVAGRFPHVHGLSLNEWWQMSDGKLPVGGVRTLGEVVASQAIHNEWGAPTNLTNDQWLERWSKIRNHPSLRY